MLSDTIRNAAEYNEFDLETWAHEARKLEEENNSFSRSLDMTWAVLQKRKPFFGGHISSSTEAVLAALEAENEELREALVGTLEEFTNVTNVNTAALIALTERVKNDPQRLQED